MYRIAAIGDKDSILGFKALGVTIYPVSEANQAASYLKEVQDEDFAVVFITEPLLEANEELINDINRKVIPAVIPIPNNQGSTGIAMERMRQMVEKAVGVDILFEKEGDK